MLTYDPMTMPSGYTQNRLPHGPMVYDGFISAWDTSNWKDVRNRFYNRTKAQFITSPVYDSLSTPSGTYPGSSSFFGGVLLQDGRVFCVPYISATARIYGDACKLLPYSMTISPMNNNF